MRLKPGFTCGFTLVEILLAVAIIALLAALALPAFNMASRSRQNAQAAGKLRTLIAAFEMYASETGDYPADVNRGVVPPEMTNYFAGLKIDWFSETNSLGGRWDWGKNQFGMLASIAIAGPSVSADQMRDLDQLIDDGDLNNGNFRYNGNEHYYYIIKP